MKSDTPSAPCHPWRRSLAGVALAGLAALLSACVAPGSQLESPPQTVQLDGHAYRVEQITASTWSAQAPRHLPDGPQKKANLVRAIEKASSCKVTDSSYGAGGVALNAQVDCGSRLKN
ncbi:MULTISPECIES: hypothetical protein [unclassified Polaromonas]|uniref:hypothetical protein n=1 Tax=unclassified Polaromonas TaxID=2638319 RepID=UPI0025EE6F1A|nr:MULTISPECIES: hypothetical protein [unclassified Polaromonas]HQR97786.1 hypothetical protein [Polaromonas sp.]HQS40897.1 hypothetical protein [Polaromonas sp.]HQS86221.1 hypothetical protein [Polaromonas sp.]HQT07962.1 hypothetical protein [Polaromonas sp.]